MTHTVLLVTCRACSQNQQKWTGWTKVTRNYWKKQERENDSTYWCGVCLSFCSSNLSQGLWIYIFLFKKGTSCSVVPDSVTNVNEEFTISSKSFHFQSRVDGIFLLQHLKSITQHKWKLGCADLPKLGEKFVFLEGFQTAKVDFYGHFAARCTHNY